MCINLSLSWSIQEDDLRKEGLAKHAHLNEELHVNIEVYAQATDAYQRLAHAITEVHKYMVPVSDSRKFQIYNTGRQV